MKKIYTLALAALCTLGASAADGLVLKQFSGKKASTLNASVMKMEKIQTQRPNVLKPMADENNQSVAGAYTLTIGDYYFEDGAGMVEEEATVSLDGTKITIESEYFQTPVEGTYNEETGEISIPVKKLGAVETNQGTVYVRFEPFVYANQSITAQTITAQWDATSQEIIFDSDNGFSWRAYNNQLYASPVGYFDLFDVIGMVKSTVEVVEWTELGEGTYKDGILAPMFGKTSEPVAVAVQAHPEIPGYYRVMNAWNSIFPGLNSNLEILVTDPEYVLVPYQNSKIKETNHGITYICSVSYAFGYMSEPALDKAAFLAQYPQYNITYDAATRTVNIPANGCGVIFPNSPTMGGQLLTANNPVEGYLILPEAAAIGSIATDESNAPVEYFNLQGVKLANPEAGQIVIRRQGSKATKVFVK